MQSDRASIWQHPRPEPPYRDGVIRDFHVELLGEVLLAACLHFPATFRYLILALLVLTIPGAVRTDTRLALLLIVFGGFG
jgi:hypothetical protein